MHPQRAKSGSEHLLHDAIHRDALGLGLVVAHQAMAQDGLGYGLYILDVGTELPTREGVAFAPITRYWLARGPAPQLM